MVPKLKYIIEFVRTWTARSNSIATLWDFR
jgi:hypothetical protein